MNLNNCSWLTIISFILNLIFKNPLSICLNNHLQRSPKKKKLLLMLPQLRVLLPMLLQPKELLRAKKEKQKLKRKKKFSRWLRMSSIQKVTKKKSKKIQPYQNVA